nr:aminoglycoside phosphotransferase family protein [Paenibacillus sp. MMS18-CY102]
MVKLDIHLQEKVEQYVGAIDSAVPLEEQGCTSEVRRIVAANGTYILKSAFKQKYREWLKAEAKVLENMNQQRDIPLPKYVGFIEEKDSSHLMMSDEPGITLTAALRNSSSTLVKHELVRSFGNMLNCLHEKHRKELPQGETDWLARQLAIAKRYVDHGLTSGEIQLLKHLEENRPKTVQQTMIHGDCTTGNVLVIDSEVRMFIDVAGMIDGDPRYDESLAIGAFREDPACLDAFYEGYSRYRVTEEEYQYFNGLYEFF